MPVLEVMCTVPNQTSNMQMMDDLTLQAHENLLMELHSQFMPDTLIKDIKSEHASSTSDSQDIGSSTDTGHNAPQTFYAIALRILGQSMHL